MFYKVFKNLLNRPRWNWVPIRFTLPKLSLACDVESGSLKVEDMYVDLVKHNERSRKAFSQKMMTMDKVHTERIIKRKILTKEGIDDNVL